MFWKTWWYLVLVGPQICLTQIFRDCVNGVYIFRENANSNRLDTCNSILQLPIKCFQARNCCYLACYCSTFKIFVDMLIVLYASNVQPRYYVTLSLSCSCCILQSYYSIVCLERLKDLSQVSRFLPPGQANFLVRFSSRFYISWKYSKAVIH